MVIKVGNDLNNILNGTDENDRLFGLGGNDVLRGKKGNDLLDGGKGNDKLLAGAGIDRLLGGKGDDFLAGDEGNDVMIGGKGNDVMFWDDGDGNDRMSGGAGIDTVKVDGAKKLGDNFVLSQAGSNVIFKRTNLNPITLNVDTSEFFTVDGKGGDDTLTVNNLGNTSVIGVRFLGGTGNDKVDGTNTATQIVADGGIGNDDLVGSSSNDVLSGGDGDDDIAGEKGDDTMSGGNGNDTLEWDDGDGSDLMSGGNGNDTVKVDGSVLQGDSFTLNQEGGKAVFDRINLGKFTLTVDTSETFDVNGEGGDDRFEVNDITGTGVGLVKFAGGDGNDTLDASKTLTAITAQGDAGDDVLIGGSANDVLDGGAGNDVLEGGAGIDTLSGGDGSDRFAFGVNALNATDDITDFSLSADQFALKSDLGINAINFQKGSSNAISGNSNVIVLLDSFANAGDAAKAIAANDNITADQGVFVYFNTTKGISRLVYSEDLSDNGKITVLANLKNQTIVGNQNNFSASNFSVA